MKLLVENWREYLNEGEQQFQIYCDMDGVLVDFVKAAVQTVNDDVADMSIPSRKETGGIKTIGRLRKALDEDANVKVKEFDWWTQLEWMPDGKQLWDYIKGFNPYILTAPMKKDGSREGKKAWVKNNLRLPSGNPPEKVFLNSKKYLYANVGSTSNILIDDMTKNTIPWNDASKDTGSVAILHTSTADTIKQLEQILKKWTKRSS